MKWPRTLRGQLLASHVFVTLVGVALVAVFAGRTLTLSRIAEAEHSLEDVGFLVSNELEEPVKEYDEGETQAAADITAILARHARLGSPDLIVILPDGQIITAAGVTEPPGDLREEIEVRGALAGEDLHDIRRDSTGREMLYGAVPIEHESQVYGVLQLATPMAPVREQIARTLVVLIGVVLGVTALVGGVAWWLAESLARPIAHLTEAAGRMAEGRLDYPVPSSGNADEIRRLEQAFNEMARRLQALLDDQRMFVANASHELRTPLTSLKLRAEALRAGAYQDPEAGPKFMAEIESEIDRLTKMVNDLLDLSRIESGLDAAAAAPVELAQLAGEARDAFSVRAERAGVNLIVAVEGTPPPAAGNESHLRRLLDNLLDNAIRHTPSGGQVTIRVEAADDRRPTTDDSASAARRPSSIVHRPPSVTLTVSDTGSGIAPEYLPHVFERFYRGAASARHGGSGLGLSIVQSIARAYGGAVSAESELGRGTAIRVVLPAYR
ncbi:MAG: HAMP domain-containing sensor histidine kinase [Chloroflexota bacterium]